MDYVNSGILTANPLVQALDRRVQDVKHSEAERVSYMTYELHLRDARKAGEAEGEEKGRMKTLRDNVRSLMQSMHCDAGRAMDLLNVPSADRQAVFGQL